MAVYCVVEEVGEEREAEVKYGHLNARLAWGSATFIPALRFSAISHWQPTELALSSTPFSTGCLPQAGEAPQSLSLQPGVVT